MTSVDRRADRALAHSHFLFSIGEAFTETSYFKRPKHLAFTKEAYLILFSWAGAEPECIRPIDFKKLSHICVRKMIEVFKVIPWDPGKSSQVKKDYSR